MEVDNSVFGLDAENTENFDNNLNFIFNHENKEITENNIDDSAKGLTDFFELVSKDVPDLTDEEINEGIEKILERCYPEKAKTEPLKAVKKKKVSVKVLFLAAVLSVIAAVCGMGVVGSSHDISIENGLATFAKDTLQIVFFGETEEKYITVDALLTDLASHGYEDILFPQEFVNRSDKYKSSLPMYLNDTLGKQASFEIYNTHNKFSFVIGDKDLSKEASYYTKINNVETIHLNDVYIYVFELDNSMIEFVNNDFYYLISSDIPYEDMVNIAQNIK